MPRETENTDAQARVEKMAAIRVEMVRRLTRQVKELTDLVAYEIDGGSPEAGPQLVLSLQVIEESAHMVGGVLKGTHGELFFSKPVAKNGKTEDAVTIDIETENGGSVPTAETVAEKAKPESFEELLRQKIKELVTKPVYSKDELWKLNGGMRGMGKVVGGLRVNRSKTYTCDEAREVLYQFLTTPDVQFLKNERYAREQIVSSFRVDENKIMEWSKLIGHDWTNTPRVDYETATQIRGLSRFDRIPLE